MIPNNGEKALRKNTKGSSPDTGHYNKNTKGSSPDTRHYNN